MDQSGNGKMFNTGDTGEHWVDRLRMEFNFVSFYP
jgi:hypothetical protein